MDRCSPVDAVVEKVTEIQGGVVLTQDVLYRERRCESISDVKKKSVKFEAFPKPFALFFLIFLFPLSLSLK